MSLVKPKYIATCAQQAISSNYADQHFRFNPMTDDCNVSCNVRLYEYFFFSCFCYPVSRECGSGAYFDFLKNDRFEKFSILPLSPIIKSLNRWSYSLAIVCLRKRRVINRTFSRKFHLFSKRKCRRTFMTYACAVGLYIN